MNDDDKINESYINLINECVCDEFFLCKHYMQNKTYNLKAFVTRIRVRFKKKSFA